MVSIAPLWFVYNRHLLPPCPIGLTHTKTTENCISSFYSRLADEDGDAAIACLVILHSDIINIMKIRILGSGTSHGIPVVGCECPVCRSIDQRDKRMRSSVYIEGLGGETALLDAGPEFRLQAVQAGIRRLDGVFLTHAHADHVHGLDDLRPISHKKSIPVYGNERTIEEMYERFSYVFRESQHGGGKPNVHLLQISSPVRIGGLTIRPVPVMHGKLEILGFDIEETGPPARRLVYITDASAISAVSFKMAENPELLILGALRLRQHPTHFNFDEALEAAIRINAGQTLFTHICHDLSHKEITDYCEKFAKAQGSRLATPAFDGQEIVI